MAGRHAFFQTLSQHADSKVCTGLRDPFSVDIDHKPLALLRIERMRVRLRGFNFRMHYTPGKRAGVENNDAFYYSRHPEPNAGDSDGGSKDQSNSS